MHVKGWIKSTLVDYPGKIAASLFCGGCNFACPNCHNRDLVLDPAALPDVPADEIESFFQRRQGLLDGVVISGGEPTLQPDLAPFCCHLRELGFRVKLDTNGYRPDVLRALLDEGLLDYVAMDVKAPVDRYAQAAGVDVDVRCIEQSLDLLMSGRVPYEFRTTVVPGLLVEVDIELIARRISGAPQFALQQFVPHNTLDSMLEIAIPYLPARLRAMADLARPHVGEVLLRGI